MSRALTVFSRKEHREANQDEVERVMEEQGCSEPVARNMLKCARLGMGPLVTKSKGMEMMPRELPDMPGRFDRKSQQAQQAQQAALAEKRLRENENNDDDKPDGKKVEKGEKMSVPNCFEMGAAIKPKAPKKMISMIGMSRLGPVEARQEEVDPLKPARVLEKEPEDEIELPDYTTQQSFGSSESRDRNSAENSFAAAHERRVAEKKDSERKKKRFMARRKKERRRFM